MTHHPHEPSAIEQRVAALESLLVERGLVTTDAIDAVVATYEDDLGPLNELLKAAGQPEVSDAAA